MGMARTVCVIVSASDRRRLEGIAADRNRPREHVERVRVVPASAEDGSVQRVAVAVGSITGLDRSGRPPS